MLLGEPDVGVPAALPLTLALPHIPQVRHQLQRLRWGRAPIACRSALPQCLHSKAADSGVLWETSRGSLQNPLCLKSGPIMKAIVQIAICCPSIGACLMNGMPICHRHWQVLLACCVHVHIQRKLASILH